MDGENKHNIHRTISAFMSNAKWQVYAGLSLLPPASVFSFPFHGFMEMSNLI